MGLILELYYMAVLTTLRTKTMNISGFFGALSVMILCLLAACSSEYDKLKTKCFAQAKNYISRGECDSAKAILGVLSFYQESKQIKDQETDVLILNIIANCQNSKNQE